MVNLYQLLGLAAHADAQAIAAAIQARRLQADLNSQVLDKAEEWLLNPAVRAQYDAQLRAHDAAFFAEAAQDLPAMNAAPVDAATMPSSAPVPHTDNKQAVPVNTRLESPASAPSNQTNPANQANNPNPATSTSASHATSGRKKIKTTAAPKHRLKIKHGGKKSSGRGCLMAFLIVMVLGLLVLGLISWWGYSMFKEVKNTLNGYEIENMQTTPGWHIEQEGDSKVVYAVAQNQPNMVLMLMGEDALPMLANRDGGKTVWCHRDQTMLCRLQVQYDQDPPRVYEAGQIGTQILVSDANDKAEMPLRLQDTDKLSIKLLDNPQVAPFEFVLGPFPSDSMVRAPKASDAVASDMDAEVQKLEAQLQQLKAEAQAMQQNPASGAQPASQ
ncbi:hypothetical protein LVJ82_16360 [Vitreoscilla massiliensis]|uniref:J domain-containing protein n=1 Tax=Vitreoscilla massiliensis TaxID=1689272 RepID=A0ABY4E0B3_9NEIS|nr:hypothetical protein [Vitreoscilla massiliensis]UOO88997.1 hypothetical protein LVJ82_16360 [Vitreoscilla massiliensis]